MQRLNEPGRYESAERRWQPSSVAPLRRDGPDSAESAADRPTGRLVQSERPASIAAASDDYDGIALTIHATGESSTQLGRRSRSCSLDPVAWRRTKSVACRADGEWSPNSSMSAAAVAAWMLVTDNRGAEQCDRVGYFRTSAQKLTDDPFMKLSKTSSGTILGRWVATAGLSIS